MSEGWLKGRLAETGNSCICVRRLDGNSTAAQKKKVMEDFRTGWGLDIEGSKLTFYRYPCVRSVSVLFCTEVAAMGVHCPDLCLGVSLGMENMLLTWPCDEVQTIGAWTTRWKCVQTSGRVGRHPSQSAAYITVYERKVTVRGWSLMYLCYVPDIHSNFLILLLGFFEDQVSNSQSRFNFSSTSRARRSKGCKRDIFVRAVPQSFPLPEFQDWEPCRYALRLKIFELNSHSFFSHLRWPLDNWEPGAVC